MLGQRLRRCPNIEPALDKCTMVERKSSCPDICITCIQRRPNVFDVGPTLHKVIQMFCVYWPYWASIQVVGSSRFHVPAVVQSVALQASEQVGARAKGFELLTHRCRSSTYELAVI